MTIPPTHLDGISPVPYHINEYGNIAHSGDNDKIVAVVKGGNINNCQSPNAKFIVAACNAAGQPFHLALAEAKAIVNGSPLFKKFIAGTPLENDIAVWMAGFRLTPTREPRGGE